MIEVRTQEELDRALRDHPDDLIACVGNGWFTVTGSSHVVARESSHVVAWGSSHVEAWGSSHVEAWGSSHVVAWESSHVVARESSHVVAWGSSHVEARESSHVEAWGSSHVEARESSHVVAGRWVSVLPGNMQWDKPTISGGVILERPVVDTPEMWCEYHGAPIRDDGTVVLYKAVDDEFRSGRGFAYTPGTAPAAPDWDGGERECGGGLHFAVSPSVALGFMPEAVRFVACPVRVDEIAVHADADYPLKVKAPRVALPCWEVTVDGEPMLMSEILSEREAEEWWRWMVRVGAPGSNSLRVSYEALAARLAEVEAERDTYRTAQISTESALHTARARLAEVEQALRTLEAIAGNVVLVDDEADLLVPDWRAVVDVLREAIDTLRAVLDKGEQP